MSSHVLGLNDYKPKTASQNYDAFLGEIQFDSGTGQHYRIVKAAAAITAAAGKCVVSAGGNAVRLPYAAGQPIAGVVPANIDTTNIAISAYFSIVCGKGDPVTFKKVSTAAISAGSVVKTATTGLVSTGITIGQTAIGVVAAGASTTADIVGSIL